MGLTTALGDLGLVSEPQFPPPFSESSFLEGGAVGALWALA